MSQPPPPAAPDAARPAPPHVLVLGAGVIGLTTAIRLRDAGHPVTVLAAETPSTICDRRATTNAATPPDTYASIGAGGLWKPTLLSDPRVPRWATATYRALCADAAAPAPVGVSLRTGFIVSRDPLPLPWYAALTAMTRETPASDPRVPAAYPHALRFRAPVAHMPVYLPHLEAAARARAVHVCLTREHAPPDHPARWPLPRVRAFARDRGARLLVICAGLHAADLVPDRLVPGRGVTVRARRPDRVDYFIGEAHNSGYHDPGLLAYAHPRGDLLTLGGTIFRGDWREAADQHEVQGVLARAQSLLVGVSDLQPVDAWTGLRPIRMDGRARVERISHDLVANYGHGGSGVTVCWGCADHVVEIVRGMA